MLNGIKAMINEKKSFQEAAEVIFEDASGANLDDLIVLGEDTDLPEPDDDNDNDDVKNEPEDNSSNDDIIPEDNSKNDNNDSSNNDIIDTPITNNEGDGLEEPLPIPGDDTLPTPVGKQTGEPITDTDDILNVSIDLKSNTVSDVLPVPPSNAGEAIASDDILSQKIDSGFGNEEPVSTQPEIDDDLLNENIEDGSYTEAITLDGEGKSNSGDEGGEGNSDLPDDGSSDEGGSEGEENSVTKQVRDKVEESETTEEPPLDDTSSNDSNKGDLLKDLSNKLGNITKSLEDAKKVVNSL